MQHDLPLLTLKLIGVDWDYRTKTKGIYRISSPQHKGWSRNVDTELGNYDFLLGIDVSSHFNLLRCKQPNANDRLITGILQYRKIWSVGEGGFWK